MWKLVAVGVGAAVGGGLITGLTVNHVNKKKMPTAGEEEILKVIRQGKELFEKFAKDPESLVDILKGLGIDTEMIKEQVAAQMASQGEGFPKPKAV